MKKIEKQYDRVHNGPFYRNGLDIEKTLDVIIDAVNTLIPSGKAGGDLVYTGYDKNNWIDVPQDKNSLREEFHEKFGKITAIYNEEKGTYQYPEREIADWWLSKIKSTVEGRIKVLELPNEHVSGLELMARQQECDRYNKPLYDLLSAFNLDK